MQLQHNISEVFRIFILGYDFLDQLGKQWDKMFFNFFRSRSAFR
jgi:hypothetical protein